MTLLRWAVLAGALMLPQAASPQGEAVDASTEAALKIVERTKTTRTTYSVYFWNRVAPDADGAFEEWSAEFHMGDLHRVETPRDRLIADCAKRTGTAFSVSTGEMTEGEFVAAAACGINTGKPFLSAETRGSAKTRFGMADRVRVTDAEHVRDYDVSKDGVLLGAAYSENQPGGRTLIVTAAVGLSNRVSDARMFDRASLSRSFVPPQYRSPPPGRADD